MISGQRDIARKLRALNYADQIGNVSKTCRIYQEFNAYNLPSTPRTLSLPTHIN